MRDVPRQGWVHSGTLFLTRCSWAIDSSTKLHKLSDLCHALPRSTVYALLVKDGALRKALRSVQTVSDAALPMNSKTTSTMAAMRGHVMAASVFAPDLASSSDLKNEGEATQPKYSAKLGNKGWCPEKDGGAHSALVAFIRSFFLVEDVCLYLCLAVAGGRADLRRHLPGVLLNAINAVILSNSDAGALPEADDVDGSAPHEKAAVQKREHVPRPPDPGGGASASGEHRSPAHLEVEKGGLDAKQPLKDEQNSDANDNSSGSDDDETDTHSESSSEVSLSEEEDEKKPDGPKETWRDQRGSRTIGGFWQDAGGAGFGGHRRHSGEADGVKDAASAAAHSGDHGVCNPEGDSFCAGADCRPCFSLEYSFQLGPH